MSQFFNNLISNAPKTSTGIKTNYLQKMLGKSPTTSKDELDSAIETPVALRPDEHIEKHELAKAFDLSPDELDSVAMGSKSVEEILASRNLHPRARKAVERKVQSDLSEAHLRITKEKALTEQKQQHELEAQSANDRKERLAEVERQRKAEQEAMASKDYSLKGLGIPIIPKESDSENTRRSITGY